MTLREQQSLFMRLFGQLIGWAYANVSTSTITFELCNGTCSGTGFTNSGSKGLNNGWTVTYSLD